MAKNDGGPAFPSEGTGMVGMNPYEFTNPGMTLRQWYAGMALQGLVSLPDHDCTTAEIASDALNYAKAMLKAEESYD